MSKTEMTRTLSPEKRGRWNICFKTIRDNAKACVATLEALAEIKADELYVQAYGTWERFCEEIVLPELGFERAHADRLLEFRTFKQALKRECEDRQSSPPAGGEVDLSYQTIEPPAERTTRPLSKVPKADRPAAYYDAAEAAGGRPELHDIEIAVQTRLAASEAPDSEPGDQDRAWPKRLEFMEAALVTYEDALQYVKNAKSAIQNKLVQAGPGKLDKAAGLSASINFGGIVQHLQAVIRSLTANQPQWLCGTCGGEDKDCPDCLGRGWMPKGSKSIATKKQVGKARSLGTNVEGLTLKEASVVIDRLIPADKSEREF